jgi:hypothetical protein
MRTLLITAFTLCSYCIYGDTITLQTGRRIDGAFLGGDSRTVRFAVGDQVVSYNLNEIKDLEFGPSGVSSTADAPGALASPIQSVYSATVPAGARLQVRLIDKVDSKTDSVGKTYRASLDRPFVSGSTVLLPTGCDVLLSLVESNSSGRITGRTSLTLAMKSITLADKTYDVASSAVLKTSGSRTTKSTEVIGGTAALGTLLGAIAGGGKGAAIGALSGGAVGTTAQVITSGERVHVPSETRLVFTLSNPLPLQNGQ